eukprot:TRINITY_DN7433_c0_g2_i1.p1 TRINITY_DN7433_c0_g2~~TRINITY_DN7433_c0_g2_i1.p1  ORF type:complete len:781 (-),score=100.61 TRINITY_DN7433_c0_g2_i1:252-2300(-)
MSTDASGVEPKEMLRDIAPMPSSNVKGKGMGCRPVNVPSAAWGAIIGRGGANLRSLQEEFDVRIRVPQADAPAGSSIMIFGLADACEACEKRLRDLSLSLVVGCDNNQPRLVRISKTLTHLLRYNIVEIETPTRSDGYRPLDQLIRQQWLQELDCTKKDIDEIVKTRDKQHFEMQVIDDVWMIRTVQGHSMNASRAQDAAAVVYKVNVPRSKWGTIIGKGGANLRSLQEEFGVRIKVPRLDDDPADSMVTITGPVEACEECERRLLGSATSSLQRSDAGGSASTTSPELGAKAGDREITVHVVSAVTGEGICVFGADKCWRGVQVKAAIQQATRIPCIQHQLLLNGCVLEDHKVLDHLMENHFLDVQVMFIRLNPTRKLYWKITLSSADDISKLHHLAMSKTVGYFQRPFFHVRLLQYDTSGRCITSDVMTDDEISSTESAIEQLAGDIIDVKVTAVAVLNSAIVGRVDLPEHVRCTTGQMPIVVLADRESKIMDGLGGFVTQRECVQSWPMPWVPLCSPVIVQGHIELKATWPAGEVPQFFDASRAPSDANMQARMARGSNRDSFSASIVDSMFVSVKQHSSMGAAIILFKVQQHRDLLISRYSHDPLWFRGTRIDLKPHKEKQPDGTLMEIPACAFAGWKRQRNSMRSPNLMFEFGMFEDLIDPEEHMIVLLFDYLCSCC